MRFSSSAKKYLFVFLGAIFLGVLGYAGREYLAARKLAYLDAQRIDGGWYAEPRLFDGVWYRVPPNEVYSSGITEGDIPALINPSVTTVASVDSAIADDLGGIALTVNGESRFYPVQIMNWHEVVHDTLGGESVLVYYAPLTGAATVYALPEGKQFVVSGQEYNNDVFLKEVGTDTLWSGILGAPVVSVNPDFSQELERLPSMFMMWKEWKELYASSGTVLSFDTGHERDYTRHPYGNYEKSPGVYFPVNHSATPVRAKEPAYLVQHVDGDALFLDTTLLLDQTPSVHVGTECFVGMRDQLQSYMQIFDCTVNDVSLTFTRSATNTFTDTETGSTWNVSGEAIAGELKGSVLSAVPSARLYTFAADALFPQAVYMGEEFIFEEEQGESSDSASGTVIEGENTDGATVEVLPVE